MSTYRRPKLATIVLLTLLLLLELACEGRIFRRGVHGPMVGATTSDEAKIWIRTGYPTRVRVRYGTDPKRLAQRSEVVTTSIDGDYTAVMRLGGLQPDTRYYYVVEATEGILSRAVNSFRTPPRSGGLLKIAFGSCARFDDLSIFGPVLQNEPHLLVLLGDNVYSDTADVPSIQRAYRWFRERPFYDEALANIPTVAIWDDHDFLGNNTDGLRPGKEGSLAVFKQYWANPSYGLPGTPGVFFTLRFGDVEIFMIDGRYHRRVEPNSMLGTVQREWLLRSLAASTARVKILASGSTWGSSNSADSWGGFRAERDQIWDFVMRQRIAGVILISGDIHRPAVFRHPFESSDAYTLYEFVSSPLSNNVRNCSNSSNPNQLFCESILNFGLLHVDTRREPAAVTYELRGPQNRVHYRLRLELSQLRVPASAPIPELCSISTGPDSVAACLPTQQFERR